MQEITFTVGRILAVRWLELTVRGLDEVLEQAQSLHAACGQRIIFMSVTNEEHPPVGRVRSALLTNYRQICDLSEDFYAVLEATGFKGAAVRSAVAGMCLLDSRSRIVSVFGSVEAALAVLSQRWPSDGDTTALAKKLAQGAGPSRNGLSFSAHPRAP